MTIPADGKQFFDLVDSYLNLTDREIVRRGFALARQEHGDAKRKSGELFFTHPLTVAYYLADFRLDASALVAALLHDVAEDTRVSVEEIEAAFGPEVSRLVDGVTKLKDVTAGVFQGEAARGRDLTNQQVQEASLHKLFDHTTADVRVVLIKIFDRLHNMRTIRAMPPHKQRQKAEETLAVYAPMANRLGMWHVKNELESLSLQVLDNSAHAQIARRLEHLARAHQAIFPEIVGQIMERLVEKQMPVLDVVYSPRQVYSIYRDLKANRGSYEDIDNALRLVVLLDNDLDCYTAMGCLHQMWPPVPHQFDDYVAVPRENLYRSLHTTVVHESGQHLKIRLRTIEMDKTSEIGVLARWLYKGSPLWSASSSRRVDAFLDNIKENINLEPHDLGFGVQGVVDNVLQDQIRVYTPQGELKELSKGATPVDFAYAIHTEVGNQTYAAYVDGKPFPLNRSLPNGAQVRIEMKRGQGAQRMWLDEDLGYVTTSRAKARIRRSFRRLPATAVMVEGKRLLNEELKMLGFQTMPHEQAAQLMGLPTPETLYRDLGRAEMLPTDLATRVAEAMWDVWPSMRVGSEVVRSNGDSYRIAHADGHELRLCRACRPEPGTRIMGYLRVDGRVTVHRVSCVKLPGDPRGARTLKLNWADASACDVRVVAMEVDAHDRMGLLNEITDLMLAEQINIEYFAMPHEGRMRHLVFEVALSSPRLLVRILHQVLALANVTAVRCLINEKPLYAYGPNGEENGEEGFRADVI
ncbi:MAG: bifunctional (p)ppGpp synthetase/guanosine-3',5'-bis(diphosphate) 3'-pyrophosphohydrolase [Anaerolineales bacterium]|nr:bifunctional (p)ppGpp synthetase/guanosine-3',5'-bis(diphosphate) 3'-pyrophosphohydrolase [Anaerolineales bacterium]MCB8950509.1 bifunctional (p)ppGpp synthetase/guanosine-3',5'-bis(diphosphate) 3'-pyrophosphohydrolase [Ardenticatenales bacterium]